MILLQGKIREGDVSDAKGDIPLIILALPKNRQAERMIVRNGRKYLSVFIIIIAILCVVFDIGQAKSDSTVGRRMVLEIDEAVVEDDIIRFQQGGESVDAVVIRSYPALNTVLIEAPSRKDVRFIKAATSRIILTRYLQNKMNERTELIKMGDKALKAREFQIATEFYEEAAKIEIYDGYDDGANSRLKTAKARLGVQTKSMVKLIQLENVRDSDTIRFLTSVDLVDAKVIAIYPELGRVMVEIPSEEDLKVIEYTERIVVLTGDLQQKISQRKGMIKKGDESSEQKEFEKAVKFYKKAAETQIYDGYDDGAKGKLQAAEISLKQLEIEKKLRLQKELERQKKLQAEEELRRQKEIQAQKEADAEEKMRERRSLLQRIKEFIRSKIRREKK